MTLAQFVVTITIALTTIAVALIVGAVLMAESERKQKVFDTSGVIQLPEDNRGKVEWLGAVKWIPVEEQKPGADHVLVTLQHAPDDFEVCEMDYWTVSDEWRDKVVAWTKMPEPYKK